MPIGLESLFFTIILADPAVPGDKYTESMLTLADVQPTVSVVLFDTVSVVDFVSAPNHPIMSIAIDTVIAISMTEAISGETPFLMQLLAIRLINNFYGICETPFPKYTTLIYPHKQ